MPTSTSIKIINGALDETPQGDIILRGVVDPLSLLHLKSDEYQREVLSGTKIGALREAYRQGSEVPDIVLGMRGENYIERQGIWYLQDPTFLIDGLQRRTAALALLDEQGEAVPHVGAKVHFGTNEEVERKMFDRLNVGQTKLSGNVILRNLRMTNNALEALHRLTTTDKTFAMHGLVSWDQYKRRGTVLSATTFARIVAVLHSHAGPGRSSQVSEIANGLNKIMENVGKPIMIGNVKEFFQIVDQCWNIKRVTYTDSATYLKANFLVQLAKIFSDHSNFWKEGRLVVERSIIKKLAAFNLNDPEIMRLAAATGTAGPILYMLLKDYMDSGKRTGRMQPRRQLHDRAVSSLILVSDAGDEETVD